MGRRQEEEKGEGGDTGIVPGGICGTTGWGRGAVMVGEGLMGGLAFHGVLPVVEGSVLHVLVLRVEVFVLVVPHCEGAEPSQLNQ